MITSNKLKFLKSLQQKKHRDKENKFIIEGYKMVEEVLRYHKDDIIELFATSDFLNIHPEISHHNFTILTTAEAKKISSLKTPPSILALVKMFLPEKPDLSSENDLILCLDAIRDPGNLGTIIRLADWFGIKNIVCSTDSVDCYNPKVIQATMGAVFRTRIFYTKLSPFLTEGRLSGYEIAGATLDGKDIYKSSLKQKTMLVMGNESNGISPNVKTALTQQIYIPAFSNHQRTESLNVSIATSVILSEFRRTLFYSK